MSDFIYFAYGSNMLAARLRQRCPSAVPIGIADAPGYVICFRKHGLDGSGKATLVRSVDAGAATLGVVYRVALDERPALDRAESRYDREDAFEVRDLRSGALFRVSTYLAQAEACRNGLLPYDWYVTFLVAGAREHGFDGGYIAKLAALPMQRDTAPERAARMAAILGMR